MEEDKLKVNIAEEAKTEAMNVEGNNINVDNNEIKFLTGFGATEHLMNEIQSLSEVEIVENSI